MRISLNIITTLSRKAIINPQLNPQNYITYTMSIIS